MRMIMKTKKAQMEMVGLVVIVILITLGMLFMVTFALKSSPGKKIFTGEGLVYSTIIAVMKTTVDERADCTSGQYGKEFQTIGADILDDCAQFFDATTSEFQCIGPISGESKHSCEFLNETIGLLLDKTLGSWNKHYEFRSKLIVNDKVVDIVGPIKVGGGCPKYKDRDSSEVSLSTESGEVWSVLYLCD